MGMPFVRLIYQALRSQVLPIAEIVRTSSIEHARQEVDRTLFNTELVKPITELYRTFGFYSARKTTREINRSVRQPQPEKKAGFGFNEELLQEIIRFLRENILSNVVIPITQTTRKDILAMIEKGQTEGWGADRIAYELERPDFPLWRARMIVRTESQFAMQYGQQTASDKSRWQTEKEWIAANDHRTRHAHRDVDGVKVDNGKKFRVPIYKGRAVIGHDFMLGPGDRTATAGNVINCRCTMVTVAKRDKDGRLVPKKVGNSRISVILPNRSRSSLPTITI